MELRWSKDSIDWDLHRGAQLLGYLRPATGGEFIWVNTVIGYQNQFNVLGTISLKEAKSVVEAVIRLEG